MGKRPNKCPMVTVPVLDITEAWTKGGNGPACGPRPPFGRGP
jgi:hypothetical protein